MRKKPSEAQGDKGSLESIPLILSVLRPEIGMATCRNPR